MRLRQCLLITSNDLDNLHKLACEDLQLQILSNTQTAHVKVFFGTCDLTDHILGFANLRCLEKVPIIIFSQKCWCFFLVILLGTIPASKNHHKKTPINPSLAFTKGLKGETTHPLRLLVWDLIKGYPPK